MTPGKIMPMVCLPRRSLFAFLLPLAAVSPVHSDEADVINFRASVNSLWDNNLFRVPDRRNPQSENIITTVAGVDFNKRISLQRFTGQVSWVDTRYQKNDYLNAGTLHYDGKWLWEVGSHLKGELAASRNAVQNSFADFPNLRQRNLRTTESQRFGLDYAVNPSWHVTGGLSRLTVANDHVLVQENDLEANSTFVGLRHTPRSGNSIGFQTRQTEGRYTKRQPNTQIDNGFTEHGQEINANWQVTGHSTFNGRLEYLRREHPNLSIRDFSGWTGQLAYLYKYSDKTSFTATYLRGLNAFQDATSSYYVSDDLVLGSRWEATAKVAVSARMAYSQRQYRGQTVAGPRREDDVYRAGIDVSYQADRWLELKAGLATERRDSNDPLLDFTDRQFLLSAIARF
jgi:exopolysaccharide biosynthesis operon protein EpsL